MTQRGHLEAARRSVYLPAVGRRRQTFGQSIPSVLLATVLLAAGCAAMARSAREQEILYGWAQQKVYRLSLEELWPRAREFVFMRGYEVKADSAHGGYSMQTAWRREQESATRLLVQGTPAGRTGARVSISRITRGRSGESVTEEADRALDLEWELWKVVDPSGAAAAEAKAEEHARREYP